MNGFQIDTQAMAEATRELGSVYKELSRCGARLREARTALAEQQGACEEERADLQRLTADLEREAYRTRELAAQCEAVSLAYRQAETKAAKIVSGLSVGNVFSGAVGVSASWLRPAQVLVQTDYKPVEAYLLTGNSLPCEDWLLERMLERGIREKERGEENRE